MNSAKSPPIKSPNDYRFIGYWHYNPVVLQFDNKEPLDSISHDLAMSIGLHKCDLKDAKNRIYYTAPNYAQWKRDEESAKMAADPIAWFFHNDEDDSDDEDKSGRVGGPRPPPVIREVRATK